MIGAVSASNSYAGLQWPSYAATVRGGTSTAAQNFSDTTILHKASDPETPVQPVDTAAPVTSEASGNLNIDLSVRNSVDVSEMAVRMRISPENPDAQPQKAGVQDQLEAEEAERQARLEERVELEKEAKAEREAYMESLAEAEQVRDQRLEALREAQAEESGTEEEGKAISQEDEKGQGIQQTGFLELDYVSALLQNYQMTNLLHEQIAARMKGEDTTGYSAAIDAVFQNSQSHVRFVSGDESEGRSNARQGYRQFAKDLMSGVAA